MKSGEHIGQRNHRQKAFGWLLGALRFLFKVGSRGEEAGSWGPGFRAQYVKFQEILAANDAILEFIADIEDAISDRNPLALDTMIERLRHAIQQVHGMTQNLIALASGQHAGLHQAVRRITEQIDAMLPPRKRTFGSLVMPLRSLRSGHAGLVGTKLSNLAEAWWGVVGVDIPDGFAITAASFARFMTENDLWDRVDRLEDLVRGQNPAAAAQACERAQAAIRSGEIPQDVRKKVLAAYDALAGGEEILVAMRSSAIGEDRTMSHAGLYHTELNVPRAALFDVYRKVVASAYSKSAVTYRAEQGLSAWESTMAVGCMKMVDARCAGVAFTRDYRASEANRMIISAISGLADGLVAGEKDAQEIVVEGSSIELPGNSAVTSSDVENLIAVGRLLEKYFEKPQDIEWAIDRGGNLFILQSRPMTIVGQTQEAGLVGTDGMQPILSGGRTGYPGWGSGPVFRLLELARLDHVPAGCVLVARHSSPEIARVMNRCAAIVTEVDPLSATWPSWPGSTRCRVSWVCPRPWQASSTASWSRWTPREGGSSKGRCPCRRAPPGRWCPETTRSSPTRSSGPWPSSSPPSTSSIPGGSAFDQRNASLFTT